jgi:membrane-associated phospholipid phosphatase
MQFLTDFADQAVILPVALAIGLALLAQDWWRGAFAWGVTIIGTFAVMLILKLLLIPCGGTAIHTPSGHVAAATVVTGGLAAMLRRRRGLVLPVALVAAIVIGASRLLLEAHTWPEVVVGALVGIAGAELMPRLAGETPPGIRLRPLLLIAVFVAFVFHGLHMPAEAEIHSAAWRLARFFGVCRVDYARL